MHKLVHQLLREETRLNTVFYHIASSVLLRLLLCEHVAHGFQLLCALVLVRETMLHDLVDGPRVWQAVIDFLDHCRM